MTTTAWSRLPNAKHIDAILAHLEANPKKWDTAWDATRGAARGAAWGAARDAARDATRDATRGAARGAAWGTAWDTAWDATRDATRGAAWDAILCLIAYDDCAYILNLPSGAVRLMCSVGDQKAALLYPAILAIENKP